MATENITLAEIAIANGAKFKGFQQIYTFSLKCFFVYEISDAFSFYTWLFPQWTYTLTVIIYVQNFKWSLHGWNKRERSVVTLAPQGGFSHSGFSFSGPPMLSLYLMGSSFYSGWGQSLTSHLHWLTIQDSHHQSDRFAPVFGFLAISIDIVLGCCSWADRMVSDRSSHFCCSARWTTEREASRTRPNLTWLPH